MGQVFFASAYDLETKTCCVIAADKFHSNCYSFSGAVHSMHHLLRQNPYRVMWGGDDVEFDDLSMFPEDHLLGMSTYWDWEYLEKNIERIQKSDSRDKAMFLVENSKLWNHLDILDEAKEYFERENIKSLNYSGFLVNHAKKLSVNLSEYYVKSKALHESGVIYAIDPVPVLTETGGGALMAFSDGVTADTTEDLAGSWCGDLLQVTDTLLDGYTPIDCLFAGVQDRSRYCYGEFGTSNDGFLLKNETGELFAGVKLSLLRERGKPSHIKVAKSDNRVTFKPVAAEGLD